MVVYFDDLPISGATQAEDEWRMSQVLSQFRKYGVRVGRKKCIFLQDQVQYLGYVASRDGIQPEEIEGEAIVAASVPHDILSLQSFLGMVNFYCRFVPNLPSLLAPMNRLLKDKVQWDWSEDCAHAFTIMKKHLSASPVLTHYRNDLPLVLEVDASPYGIGGCLFHILPDGQKKPVYFVSRSLLPAKKNYGQIDCEALAIVFAVRRLHQLLYGRHFVLHTDHKPILRILGEHVGLPNTDEFTGDPCGDIPLSAEDVAKATTYDSLLTSLIRYVQHSWPQHDDCFAPYFRVRHELSIEQGVLLWNNRVIIPLVLRQALLQELHSCHVGTNRRKPAARSYFWWPSLDTGVVAMCAPAKKPLHPWVFPSKPFKRVHMDFAEYNHRFYFLLVDAYSKGLKGFDMGRDSTTSRTVSCIGRSDISFPHATHNCQ